MKLANVTRIVNLTPHDLHVHTVSGIVTIPVSGTVARVDVTRSSLCALYVDPAPGNGIRVWTSEIGRLTFTDLAGEEVAWYAEDDVLYVVSGLVRTYYDKPYFASPGEPVRDPEGRVVGCRGLDRGKWVES